MLVVVKDWDFHPRAANIFNNKAIRRFDIFQVDRAKGWFKRANDIGQFFGVAFIHFNVEAIDICELFEKNRLAFHDRL